MLGGILAPLGLVVVVLGWWGASKTPYDFEQVPYLISGGLLGLAPGLPRLFFYFAHWLTQLVKEHREQSAGDPRRPRAADRAEERRLSSRSTDQPRAPSRPELGRPRRR